jgi:hypothetical protein
MSQRSIMTPSSGVILNMEAVHSSAKLVSFYLTTWCYIPEDIISHIARRSRSHMAGFMKEKLSPILPHTERCDTSKWQKHFTVYSKRI